MAVVLDGFREAMAAALDGPDRKDVAWSTDRHHFNVKRAKMTKADDILTIDGGDGNHISHRKGGWFDDQIYYSCTVKDDGTVENLDIKIRSSLEVLVDWIGKIIDLRKLLEGTEAKADEMATIRPAPETEQMLDGSWKGDAEFLIANIIVAASLRAFPELAKRQPAEA